MTVCAMHEARVYRIIAHEAPARPLHGISRDTLLSSLGFDSFQYVALCVALEEALRVALPCDGVADARTAGDLVRISATPAVRNDSLPPERSDA